MACSRLRIVVFPDTPHTWKARALEHDLMAGGRSAEAALHTLVKLADAHIAYDIRHGHRPLSAFAPAPQMYWNAFWGAAKSAQPIELTRTEPERSLRYVVGIASADPALRWLTAVRSA